MVATTAVFLTTLTNIGPLTTTYTAPASCATALDHLNIARASSPGAVPVPLYDDLEHCGKYVPFGDCLPSGRKWDEPHKTLGPFEVDSGNNFRLPYYSPGQACPEGWAISAAVTKGAGGKLANPTGVFVAPSPQNISADLRFGYVPGAVVVAAALEQGEAAAVCCPEAEGWHLAPNLACLSVLPKEKLDPTAGCLLAEAAQAGGGGGGAATIAQVTATVDYLGATTVTTVLNSASFRGSVSAVTRTFSGTAAGSLVGVTRIPAVVLVNKAEELTKTAAAAGGAEETGKGGADAGATGETGADAVPTSAAAAMRPDGGVVGLGALVAVCATAVMAGVAVMMPW